MKLYLLTEVCVAPTLLGHPRQAETVLRMADNWQWATGESGFTDWHFEEVSMLPPCYTMDSVVRSDDGSVSATIARCIEEGWAPKLVTGRTDSLADLERDAVSLRNRTVESAGAGLFQRLRRCLNGRQRLRLYNVRVVRMSLFLSADLDPFPDFAFWGEDGCYTFEAHLAAPPYPMDVDYLVYHPCDHDTCSHDIDLGECFRQGWAPRGPTDLTSTPAKLRRHV